MNPCRCTTLLPFVLTVRRVQAVVAERLADRGSGRGGDRSAGRDSGPGPAHAPTAVVGGNTITLARP